MSSFHRNYVGAAVVILLLLQLAACAWQPAGLVHPNGVAVAPDGSLYVMDRGNYRVAHLSAEGRFLGAFGKLGVGADDIYEGWDIKLDSTGNIYICHFRYTQADDTFVDRDGVKVFTPNGRYLRDVGSKDYGTAISSEEERSSPYGLDIDREDRVYIGYYRGALVKIFDAQGEQLAQVFGSEAGQFIGLNDVAVDEERNFLYVLDSTNSNIQQFALSMTPSGEFTATWRLTIGSYGREDDQLSYPFAVAVDDASGQVYVSDMGNLRIKVFDSEGHYLRKFAPPEVKVWQTLGLDVAQDGAVYVADAFNHVIWAFEPDGQLRRRIEVKP